MSSSTTPPAPPEEPTSSLDLQKTSGDSSIVEFTSSPFWDLLFTLFYRSVVIEEQVGVRGQESVITPTGTGRTAGLEPSIFWKGGKHPSTKCLPKCMWKILPYLSLSNV